ncbi:MAG: class I SAM-dependent methyltransferase [Nitrospinae bacterium]|nr:class I SAM-dependent methyltransferase [Nitrospinota bacterium]
MGSGVGYWAEYFAKQFGKVVAVEASVPLYESLVQRCSPYANVLSINTDVLSFEPEDRFSLIFLGGLLMYLNECDVINLLQKVTSNPMVLFCAVRVPSEMKRLRDKELTRWCIVRSKLTPKFS